jgi:hypothetical protein
LDPYIVHALKSRDQWWSGDWVKKISFAILGTFGRFITNLRGTFVENVKKSPKSTHPTVQLWVITAFVQRVLQSTFHFIAWSAAKHKMNHSDSKIWMIHQTVRRDWIESQSRNIFKTNFHWFTISKHLCASPHN